MTIARTALLAAPLLLAACATTDAPDPQAPLSLSDSGPTQADLARLGALVSWMTGSFDSADQAAALGGDYMNIRLHMTPIWTDRREGAARWLYVEQSVPAQPTKPYRQRIYCLASQGNGRFTSEVFELPGDPLAYAGAWKNPKAFDDLKPQSLTARPGCVIELTDRTDAFVGSTAGRDCLSAFRGAAYTTSEVIITRDQLISWDRGFDAQGNQVWGAIKGGYIFRKRGG